ERVHLGELEADVLERDRIETEAAHRAAQSLARKLEQDALVLERGRHDGPSKKAKTPVAATASGVYQTYRGLSAVGAHALRASATSAARSTFFFSTPSPSS